MIEISKFNLGILGLMQSGITYCKEDTEVTTLITFHDVFDECAVRHKHIHRFPCDRERFVPELRTRLGSIGHDKVIALRRGGLRQQIKRVDPFREIDSRFKLRTGSAAQFAKFTGLAAHERHAQTDDTNIPKNAHSTHSMRSCRHSAPRIVGGIYRSQRKST